MPFYSRFDLGLGLHLVTVYRGTGSLSVRVRRVNLRSGSHVFRPVGILRPVGVLRPLRGHRRLGPVNEVLQVLFVVRVRAVVGSQCRDRDSPARRFPNTVIRLTGVDPQVGDLHRVNEEGVVLADLELGRFQRYHAVVFPPGDRGEGIAYGVAV